MHAACLCRVEAAASVGDISSFEARFWLVVFASAYFMQAASLHCGSGSWVMMRSDHVGHQCVFILLFIIDSSHAAACLCVLRLKGLSGVALTLTV